jgi:hypothetical protein
MEVYDEDRPPIPAQLRREIEVEAGHKCSITFCIEHTYLEIHHINRNRQDNRKQNMLLLCDKHHKMAHAGVIDEKACRMYKEQLQRIPGDTTFVRGVEGDRVRTFLSSIERVLSYDDCGERAWVGDQTGYWFEQEVYLNLQRFFANSFHYEQQLRSYDPIARSVQDEIVILLRRLLDIRNNGNYVYHGGYTARFVPSGPKESPDFNNQIDAQRKSVVDILLQLQRLNAELSDYVGNRPS